MFKLHSVIGVTHLFLLMGVLTPVLLLTRPRTLWDGVHRTDTW